MTGAEFCGHSIDIFTNNVCIKNVSIKQCAGLKRATMKVRKLSFKYLFLKLTRCVQLPYTSHDVRLKVHTYSKYIVCDFHISLSYFTTIIYALLT